MGSQQSNEVSLSFSTVCQSPFINYQQATSAKKGSGKDGFMRQKGMYMSFHRISQKLPRFGAIITIIMPLCHQSCLQKLNRIQSGKKEFANQIEFLQLLEAHLAARVNQSLPQSKTMEVSPFLKSFPFLSIIKSQLMPRTKKTYKIKRGRPKLQKDTNLAESNQEDLDQQIPDERPVPQNFKEETPIKRAVKMDPRNISNLSEEERERIKSEHPEMNEYFLMSARDKSKYFHSLNQKYRQDMKLAQPPGSAPMKKTIKFKKRFEIKPFSYHQKCEQIKAKRSFMELYKAKEDSKRKKISKFPKNI